MANFSKPDEIFNTVYNSLSTENMAEVRPQPYFEAPEGTLTLPAFYPRMKTLDQVVDVDYYIPGCPPESDQIAAVIDVVLAALRGEAELPPAGSVIGAGSSAVCDECGRKRAVKSIKRFYRLQEVEYIDPDICLLEQGILCSGPATRSGCRARCPSVNAPCAGCYGPAPGVIDYGAKLIAAIASVIDSSDPDEIDRILDGIPDPAGMFYRFNLAHSLLHGTRLPVRR